MTAIPLAYNLGSLRQRWTSSVVAVLGIAGTVSVFVAMLAMARGFKATLTSSGSRENAILMRAGSSSEMVSAVEIDEMRIVEDLPAVGRQGGEPLVSGEVVAIVALPLVESNTDANVQVRGVSPRALRVRPQVTITAGRFFTPGLPEVVVGDRARTTYTGVRVGDEVKFGGLAWKVVGSFNAGGSAFDSELWADADTLNQAYLRPRGVSQSLTVRLTSSDAFPAFKKTVEADRRLNLSAEREIEYYAKSSEMLTAMIVNLGMLVAAVLGLGAVFGALNTMYSAVAERSREVATLRAMGFGVGAVVLSFVVEALCVAFVGGVVGTLAILPINGLTTGTLNWQTFSHLSFAFRVTPDLVLAGLGFALLMGLLGGVPPALRASRLPVAQALREL